jgi:hypothetical protein
VRYTCTIYGHDYTFGGVKGFTGTDPVFDEPLARVEVSGRSLREAAARAYVECVGRRRAEQMREQQRAPRKVVAQETSRKAIAASLRKTTRRIGECYEMDNLLEGWFIKVEPVPSNLRSSRLPSGPHLSTSCLLHLSSFPSPN